MYPASRKAKAFEFINARVPTRRRAEVRSGIGYVLQTEPQKGEWLCQLCAGTLAFA